MNIVRSTDEYEAWLKKQLKGELVQEDLKEKHRAMRSHPFPFLRATYYRWAETILDVCPEFKHAPSVVAVGDIHLENFGTWRDADGRLIWGVNDFDEAAEMPFALDLVRLCVSAVLGCPNVRSTRNICGNILQGYRQGLKSPTPIVLDRRYAWLRKLVVVPNSERKHFWQKMDKLRKKGKKPKENYATALAAEMPEPKLKIDYARRTAGLGSLGRPRWVGIADWDGGEIVREAKAALPSAWTRPDGRPAQPLWGVKLATAPHRAPDPWFALKGSITVRRLSPNNRKLDAAAFPLQLINKKMLRLMGCELAVVHIGMKDRRKAIEEDIAQRKSDWLSSAVKRAVDFVRKEQREYRRKTG